VRYDPTLKNIWKCASDEVRRYALQAVSIDAEKKVAAVTDGHCLAAVDVKHLLEPEEKSFLVPIEALKAAASLYSQQRRKPQKERQDVFIRFANDAVTVSVGKSKRSQTFDPEHGQYPRWETVLPNPDGYKLGIALSADLLIQLLSALHGNYDRDSVVNLYVAGEDKPVIVGTRNMDRLNYGLLMPVRYAGDMPKRFWEQRKD
jgi:DNA polymerase III sliding clamp (beta) subunit (PCNA family)